MPGQTPLANARPAIWARALLGGSIALATVSLALLAWM